MDPMKKDWWALVLQLARVVGFQFAFNQSEEESDSIPGTYAFRS
jgi:hypothetical protein